MRNPRVRNRAACAIIACFALGVLAADAHAQAAPRRGQRPPAAKRTKMSRAEYRRLAAQSPPEPDLTVVTGGGTIGMSGTNFNPQNLRRFPTTIPGSQAVAAGTLVPGFGVLPGYPSLSGPVVVAPGLGFASPGFGFASPSPTLVNDFNAMVGNAVPSPSISPATINGANLPGASSHPAPTATAGNRHR